MPSWLDGLILFLPMDEGSGHPKDFSSYKNHGTNYGASWVDGKYGKALSFDGVNDYMEMAHSPSLDIRSAITVALWVKRISSKPWGYFIAKGADTAYQFREDAEGEFLFTCRIAGAYKDVFTDIQIVIGEWHYMAGTYDGSAVKAYWDGAHVAGKDVAATGLIDSTTQVLRIGAHGGAAPGNYTNAVIDEPRIFKRALSAAEIQRVMNMRGI